MKWLLTLLAGVIIGAGALFVYLRQIPNEPAPVVATTVAVPVAATPAPAAGLEASLPPAPVVEPDLTEADLPLAPGSEDKAAAAVPAIGADSAAVPSVSEIAATAQPQAPGGKLLVPVDGIAAASLSDTYNQPRGKERKHQALDIMAPKGTKVLAVADGKVAKLFNSKPGGLTVYQFDPTEKYAYYYAHLDRYADGVKEGSVLKRGDLVGYVGVTGNSDPKAPHLHFAVVQLTPEKKWWKGTPVNPYPMLHE